MACNIRVRPTVQRSWSTWSKCYTMGRTLSQTSYGVTNLPSWRTSDKKPIVNPLWAFHKVLTVWKIAIANQSWAFNGMWHQEKTFLWASHVPSMEYWRTTVLWTCHELFMECNIEEEPYHEPMVSLPWNIRRTIFGNGHESSTEYIREEPKCDPNIRFFMRCAWYWGKPYESWLSLPWRVNNNKKCYGKSVISLPWSTTLKTNPIAN